MSTSKIVAVAVLMTIATIGWSQTSPEEHAAHHPPEKAQAAAPAAAMADPAKMDAQEGSVAIRGLIERAEQAKTAAERERLLDEHLDSGVVYQCQERAEHRAKLRVEKRNCFPDSVPRLAEI